MGSSVEERTPLPLVQNAWHVRSKTGKMNKMIRGFIVFVRMGDVTAGSSRFGGFAYVSVLRRMRLQPIRQIGFGFELEQSDSELFDLLRRKFV